MTSHFFTPVATVRRWRISTIALLSVVVLSGCSRADTGGAGQPDSEAQLMEKGVNLLRQLGDPAAAEQVFRDVLRRNPSHYGAHYQLAVSLDRNNKPTEARREWQEVQRLAESARDSTTLATARVRLAGPDTVSQIVVMAVGLELLYKQANLSGAAAQFRSVLERNPTHYGATFQLATTLDRMGQRTQAKPLWEKVLGMAVSYKDDPTIQIARNRLK